MNKYEYYKLVTELSELKDMVYSAADLYTSLRKENGLSTNDGECWEGEVIDFSFNHVTTEWLTTWPYGGAEEGNCSIPVEAILGSEKERIEFIKSVVEKEKQ